jgi:hypothetical protein
MTLNDLYFVWLEKQINYDYKHHSMTSYRDLVKKLWGKPFPWTVGNDDNRIEDGLELRYLFLTDENMSRDFGMMNAGKQKPVKDFEIAEFRAQPCSILEVLIALSRRLEFAEGSEAGWWAWKLLVNLDLHKMKDPLTPRKASRVDDILETLVWRTYNRNGEGGFFPLAFAEDDQRKVEIWYQMAAYLAEFNHH